MTHPFEVRDEITVDARPDEVWEAIASGPGVDSWLMGRTEIDSASKTSTFNMFGEASSSSITASGAPPGRGLRRACCHSGGRSRYHRQGAGSGDRGMHMARSDRPELLAEVLDDHLAAEFATRDVDATMATMTDDPYLNHVPVLTGGIGREEVRRFYEQIFIGHWPADTTMERISRTIGDDQVVDELVMSFTHDIIMGHLLPGVPPTGKPVRLAVCVVAGFQDGKLTHEHIYWDQASLLVQVGLLDPAGLPVIGAEQAEKLLSPRTIPANALLGPDWRVAE